MLIETISIQNGAIQHLSYHQRRLNRSQQALFQTYKPIDLSTLLYPPTGSGVFKCRIHYGQELLGITYEPYHPRSIEILKAIPANIDYAYKYSDREALDELYTQRGDADDILIVRDGLVTDTSNANIAFLKGKTWYTPKKALLPGTTRERLLRSGFLVPRDIAIEELDKFEAFALMNAMIGFVPLGHGKIRY